MGVFFGRTTENSGYKEQGMREKSVGADACVSHPEFSTESGRKGYDGGTLSDVFENYESVRQGKAYTPVHFVETRKYLQQVRDQKRHIQLLENRIKYRKDAGLDTSWHEEDLEQARKELKLTIAEVAEEISKLDDINQEVVMTNRYIDVMTWDEVAMSADLKMRTVQKCHGHALPRLEEILLNDGLIELDEDEDSDEDDAGGFKYGEVTNGKNTRVEV